VRVAGAWLRILCRRARQRAQQEHRASLQHAVGAIHQGLASGGASACLQGAPLLINCGIATSTLWVYHELLSLPHLRAALHGVAQAMMRSAGNSSASLRAAQLLRLLFRRTPALKSSETTG
jgi:hypothetical protein